MHTYIKSENGMWTVGFSVSEYKPPFRAIKDFGTEAEAAAYTSYLNGGSRPPGATPTKKA